MSGRTWGTYNPARTWEQVALYPRTVAITRQAQTVTAGLNSYSAVSSTNETSIATGLPASIQIDRTGNRPRAELPADSRGEPTHKIFVASGYLAVGQVLDRDIITDDTSIRYQVMAIEWTPLGVQIRAQRLEA